MILFRPTSKMSHDHGGHDSCGLRFRNRLLHSVSHSLARGMPDVGVGSGALLAEQRRRASTEEMNCTLFSWKTEDILSFRGCGVELHLMYAAGIILSQGCRRDARHFVIEAN